MTARTTGVYDYEGPPRVDHEGHIYYEPDILREAYDIEPVPSDRRLSVVVSGGSMGGLFTAHALQQSGHDVDVFERTERGEMRGRGAGIVPDPELLCYMERHDLVGDRDEVSVVMDRLDYLDHDGDVRESRPYTVRSTSWDTFYRPLRDAVGEDAYHMGTAVVDVDRGGSTATAHFDDGGSATGDLLVAAEGYGSRTRERLLPDVTLQYAGYVAWRGIVPEHELPDDLADHLGEAFVIYHGPDFQILTYPVPGTGGSTERGDRRVNLVWYENVPEGEGLDDLYIQCIYDLKAPRMVFDRVCILGDGAFFVRPHMAAGTSKAAADGFTLAEAIATHEDLPAALDAWETSQLELGERLVRMARQRGDRYMARP